MVLGAQGNWEYTATKYALRGFMRTARRNSWEQGIRINYVAPCWIKSAIRSAEYEKWLVDHGIRFGEQIDVSSCFMRIATDKSINGKLPPKRDYFPLRSSLLAAVMLTRAESGRSLMFTPRSVEKEGWRDIDREDYKDTPEDAYLKNNQANQLVIIEDKWLDDYKVRIYKED